MGFYAGLGVALVVPFVLCIVIYKVLYFFSKRDTLAVVSTFVLGAPTSGLVLAWLAWKMPDAFGPQVCPATDLSGLIVLLFASMSSYYLCAVIIGFLRVHEYRKKNGEMPSFRRQKAKS